MTLAAPGLARAQESELDLRWRGVALSDLPGGEAALVEAAVHEANPGRFTSVVSIAWLERSVGHSALSSSGNARRAADLEGDPRHLVQIVGRHARFATATDPGTRDKPPLGVVVVEARLAGDRSDWPELRVVRESPLAALDLEIETSLSDRTVVVSDERFDFVRVYPVGVGAIDLIRRPGYVSSLTPITDNGRVWRESSSASRSAPGWNRGKPFIPFEIPHVSARDGARRWFVETRVAFHIWVGRAFSRGFVGHGCVTLRDDDLDELAAFVFERPTPIPLTVRAEEFADHRHPYPHETTHYWMLENLGTAARPILTRGSLYAIKKIDAQPPVVSELVGQFMTWERKRDPLGPVATNGLAPPPSLVP